MVGRAYTLPVGTTRADREAEEARGETATEEDGKGSEEAGRLVD